MRTQISSWLIVSGAILTLSLGSPAWADDAVAAPSTAKIDRALYQKTVERGVQYLLKSQAPDGSYSAQTSPAVTAICVTALLRSGHTPDEPAIAKSLKYLESFVQSDGGVYKPGSAIQNYETGIAIMCFAEANKNGRYKDLIKAAENYVKSIQWGGGEPLDQSDMKYGGAGYGRSKTRPDLSNTSFLLDALQAAGAESDDVAVQRALVFVSRLPESRKPIQHHRASQEEPRRRLFLYNRRRGHEHGRQHGGRWQAKLRLYDVCGTQEHDLCRSETGRYPGQSRRGLDPKAL